MFKRLVNLNTLSQYAIHIQYFRMGSLSPNVQLRAKYLELRTDKKSHPMIIDYMWLRDHCRCATCFNKSTHQRTLSFLRIPSDVQPRECEVKSSQLKIEWTDDHKSTYELSFLAKYTDEVKNYMDIDGLHQARKLWEPQRLPSIPIVKFSELKRNKSQLTEVLQSLLVYGFVTVDEVQPTLQATQEVVEMIGPVQNTFFGGMWEFGNSQTAASHEDTAYTSETLAPHHDGTYFSESSGLQVFHCLGRSNQSEGGETLLVDGMAAVHQLRVKHPKSYEILCNVATESEYIEDGSHYMCLMPVIVTDQFTKQVVQVRFNLYDRAPLRTISDTEDIRSYYAALRDLSEIIFSNSFTIQLSLMPGTVLIIDNWRILHGRNSFTGSRHMGGCYMARSDWISKARVLGLLN